MTAAKDTCRYHPTRNAIWSCDSCGIDFCQSCVPATDLSSPVSCCLCKEPLTQLAISSAIEPFWRKTNFFFQYAFHTPILMFCLFLAFIMLIPTPGTFAFWGALFFTYSSLMKLCAGICERLSEGNLELPTFGEIIGFSKEFILFRFIMVGALLGAFFQGTASYLPMPIWYLLYFFHFIGLPAILMLLVTENSVFAAINPGKMLFVMRAIGWPYAIFFGFAFILNTSSTAAVNAMSSMIPDYMAISLTVFFAGYFACVFFSMMGYTLYQYHHELGFSIDNTHLQDRLGASQNSQENWQIEAEMLIKEGRYDDAIACLEQALKRHSDNVVAYEKVTKLYKYTGNSEKLLKRGNDYIKRLAKANMAAKADAIYRDMLALKPDYQIEDPQLCLQLAQGFAQTGRAKMALRVCHNLHRRFPDFPQIDEAYWLLAKVNAENLGNDKQATQYLQFIKTHFSASRLIPEINSYLLSLEKITKAS